MEEENNIIVLNALKERGFENPQAIFNKLSLNRYNAILAEAKRKYNEK